MALDPTIGGAAADTYATLAEADAYMEARLHTTVWDAATDPNKEKALKMAARLLDVNVKWTGAAVDETQARVWPRSGMFTRNDFAIAEDAIPTDLKNAQIEFAQQLLSADRSLDSDIEVQGITKIKAGTVELGFRDDVKAKVVPDAVKNMLVPSWYDDTEYTTLVFESL